MMDIVFASDANYAPYTAVTLASVLRHYEGDAGLRVFLLLDEVFDAATTKKFVSLQSIKKHELHQIKVDASAFDGLRTSAGISIATYYRLLMHHLLPDDCRRVIYLDSDMIVKDSLSKLMEQADPAALFSGVQDSISVDYNRRFGLPLDAHHVNAGMLVVNVDQMRAIPFDTMVAEYLEANRYRIVLGDQQIITEIFHRQISYVPLRWNVHGPMFVEDWAQSNAGKLNSFTEQEINEAVRSPGIIHYTLKRKPWMSLEHPRSREWFEYLSLTDFSASIPLPSAPSTTRKPTQKATGSSEPSSASEIGASANQNMPSLTDRLAGVWKSVRTLRETRLRVNHLGHDVAHLRRDVARLASSLKKQPAPAAASPTEMPLDRDVRLKRHLTEMARNMPSSFNAAAALARLPENAPILANVYKNDVDGGYAENAKTIFRSNRIAYNPDTKPRAVVLLSQRIDQEMFWRCLNEAYLNDLPTYFVEVALFGGFAGFFDQEATLNEKRALGFMVDDMGYYFDSRQPSRVEATLNSPDFKLTQRQRQRVRTLIKRVIEHRITKYNKYVSATPYPFDLKQNSVLVIDQKRGDASIQFANANDDSFQRMTLEAIADNPGRHIYFKRHPDSIQRNFNSYRNRNLKEITVLPDDMPIDIAMEQCDSIYTVSSQVGFEGLLRGKKVVCFGVPFYAGWGLTDDRQHVPRRSARRSIEDLFHQVCIQQSVYLNSGTGKLIELEDAIDLILEMRADLRLRVAN